MTEHLVSFSVSISFDELVQAVAKLSLEVKNRLLESLEEQNANEEEQLWDQDPKLRAEIEQARADYEAGDYLSIDEYFAQQDKKED